MDISNNPEKLIMIKAELSKMIEKYATNENLPITRSDFIKMCSYMRHIAENTIKLRNKLNAVLNDELRNE